MKDESQRNCSVDYNNAFNEGLNDTDSRNILYNSLKMLDTRVTNFNLARNMNLERNLKIMERK